MSTSPAQINVNSLLSESRAAAGLSDFGEPDVIEPLRVLAAALNSEAQLHEAGVRAQHESLKRLLINRLRIQRDLTAHPEILNERIAGPVVIVGLPRTGTTKLQRMMAASDQFQTLPYWKIFNPARITTTQAGNEPDPRIAIAQEHLAALRQQHPAFYAAHPMDACEPDEEEMMMEIVLLGYLYPHVTRVPSFQNWVDTQSFERWYGYLRNLLRYFQWCDRASGKPWLLKAPAHLGFMPLLFEYFPNATVVHCHRDTLSTTASLSGLVAAARQFYSDRNDPAEVGRFVLDLWSRQMRRYTRDRTELDCKQHFVDVSYLDVVRNAADVIASVYRAAGLELSTDALQRMQEWEASNAQHKHGEHRYDLADYGLHEQQVAAAFADYDARFARFL